MGSRGSPPATSRIVIDADVLVSHLRGRPSAREFFDRIQPSRRILSAVVQMELLRGATDRLDLRRLRRFFDSSFGALVHVNEEISRRAIALVERHALAHRMKAADALVAATALTLRASLATANLRDYDFISGLHILPFKE